MVLGNMLMSDLDMIVEQKWRPLFIKFWILVFLIAQVYMKILSNLIKRMNCIFLKLECNAKNFYCSETYDQIFSEAPTKVRQLYQLCDLQDVAVIDILNKERVQIQKSDESECDVRSKFW